MHRRHASLTGSLFACALYWGIAIVAGDVADPALAASFRCAKAATAMEKLICANPELSRQDSLMKAAYARARGLPGGSREQVAQRAWLAQAQRCPDAVCLNTAYERRFTQFLRATGTSAQHTYRLSPARGLDYQLAVTGPAVGIVGIAFQGTEVGPAGVARGDVNTGSYAAFLPAGGGTFSPGRGCTIDARPVDSGSWRIVQHGDNSSCRMGEIASSSGTYRRER